MTMQTPEMTSADLPGTAFLLQARRTAKGLPPHAPEVALRLARLNHHRDAVETYRREVGRVRDRGGDTPQVMRGVRLGLAPVTNGPGWEDAPAAPHHDPSAVGAEDAALGRETAARIAAVVGADGWALLKAKALEGNEGGALAQAFALAMPDHPLAPAMRKAARSWADLSAPARRAVTKPLRYRLGKARAALAEALKAGGPLSDLGAEGWTIRAPRGGAR